MKNIHVLPTDKPSRLYYNTKGKCYAFSNKILSQGGWVENQNIYITSETEAKRIRDYVYDELSKKVVKITNDNEVVTASQKGYFKVILTTDTELIADGVQTIDDEFLEWFCSKNGEVEFVEVRKEKYSERFDNDKSSIGNPETWGNRWVLVFPKEEPKKDSAKERAKNYMRLKNGYKDKDDPKPIHEGIAISSQEILDNRCNAYEFIDFNSKETLEEAIVKGFIKTSKEIDYTEFDFASFKLGAKWQQEQNKNLYSEEEVLEHLNHLIMMPSSKLDEFTDDEEKITLKWFEQFEKKQEN